MDSIREKAYAKLNISLDVTERRTDGFHDMCMVMQTVSICDELELRPTDTGRIQVKSNFSFIPGDERNLAAKAALGFFEAVGKQGQGLLITLQKSIPVGAGMAGGSADAAAVLRALNRLYGAPLTADALETLAARVGSDVPFCVRGGTALATGRGEKLESLPSLPACKFVGCKQDFSISTPELFRKLDQTGLRTHPDTAGMLSALESGNLKEISMRMFNVFEEVDDRRMRSEAEIKHVLLDYGALGAVMTGTGSAVFGVFGDETAAETCAAYLRSEHKFCHVARPVKRLEL